MFAPDIFSVKEVKWLLETCGATLVEDDDTSEVDIVMVRSEIDRIVFELTFTMRCQFIRHIVGTKIKLRTYLD